MSISFYVIRVIIYPQRCHRHHTSVCHQSGLELGTHAEDFDWMNRIRDPVEMWVNWLGSRSALWNDWRSSYVIQLSNWLDRGTERRDSCLFFLGQDQNTSHLTNCIKAQLGLNERGSSVSVPSMTMKNETNLSKSCFCLKEASQHAAKGNLQRTDVKARVKINITWTCCTVSSDLINVQVIRRWLVEADVALHFDPHSRTNTTNPTPTNSPILPFLVLTMAGGCGVSNLMKQAGNNSWVCVEMGLEGAGGGGWVKTQVSLSKPGPGQRERELHWPQQRAQNVCQSSSQSSWKRDSGVSALYSEHESPVWPVWAHARSLRRAGRLDSNKPEWAWIGSSAELWVSEASSLLEPDFEGCTGSVTPNLIGFWTVYLFPHVFIPRSLSLFDWVGGLELDYPWGNVYHQSVFVCTCV